MSHKWDIITSLWVDDDDNDGDNGDDDDYNDDDDDDYNDDGDDYNDDGEILSGRHGKATSAFGLRIGLGHWGWNWYLCILICTIELVTLVDMEWCFF